MRRPWVSGVPIMVAVVVYRSVSHRLAIASEVVVALSRWVGTLLWKFRSSVIVVDGFRRWLLLSLSKALTKRFWASSKASVSSAGSRGVPRLGSSSASSSPRFCSSVCVTPHQVQVGLVACGVLWVLCAFGHHCSFVGVEVEACSLQVVFGSGEGCCDLGGGYK